MHSLTKLPTRSRQGYLLTPLDSRINDLLNLTKRGDRPPCEIPTVLRSSLTSVCLRYSDGMITMEAELRVPVVGTSLVHLSMMIAIVFQVGRVR